MSCLRIIWVFLLVLMASCGRSYKRDNDKKSEEIEQLRRQLITTENDKEAALAALAKSKTELTEVGGKLTALSALLQPILGASFRFDSETDFTEMMAKLAEFKRQVQADTVLHQNVTTMLGLTSAATAEAIVTALTQLIEQKKTLVEKVATAEQQLALSLKTQATLTDKLKVAQEENEKIRAAASVGVYPDTLGPFVGIWVAELPHIPTVPAGCRLIVRIDSKPGRIMRAVICDDGRLDYINMVAVLFGTTPSPFAGSLLLTVENRVVYTSCQNEVSAIAAISSLSFDLRTASGGIPVSYAYAQLGDQRITLHNGAGITELSRNNKCDTISTTATRAGSGANALLKTALKACEIEHAPAGCFTARGYLSPPTR